MNERERDVSTVRDKMLESIEARTAFAKDGSDVLNLAMALDVLNNMRVTKGDGE